ncbi:hypothetical protein A2U01_0074579, partial [Trifolium medium]|nr:hypothetical protein [Trifolium medium]
MKSSRTSQSPVCDQDEVHSTQGASPQGWSGAREIRISDTFHASETQEHPTIWKTSGEFGRGDGNPPRSSRANSCPPAANRSVI